jgi:S1-C subfamily serine protease
MITIRCRCGEELTASDAAAGQSLACTACGEVIHVPIVTRTPDPAPPRRPAPGPRRAPRPRAQARPLALWPILSVACLGVAVLAVLATVSASVNGARDRDATVESFEARAQELRDALDNRDLVIGNLEGQLSVRPTTDALQVSLTRQAELEAEIVELEANLSRAWQDNREARGRIDAAREALDASAADAAIGDQPAGEFSVADLVEVCGLAVTVVATESGTGSGFFIDSSGYLVTNYHVVSGAGRITVGYLIARPGRVETARADAAVIAVDLAHDLALLRVGVRVQVPALPLADRPPRVGEEVVAIGNPGLGGTILERTVTTGILSSAAREIEGVTYLQVSAAINPGCSGGPLLDRRGKVLGVLTATGIDTENIGFALPADYVRALWGGRDGAFRIAGSLADWEAEQGIEHLYDLANAIRIDGRIADFQLAEAQGRVYVLDGTNNSLKVISLTDGKVTDSMFVGSEPRILRLDEDLRTAWVYLDGSRDLVRVDLENLEIEETVDVPNGIRRMAVADRGVWYLAQRGGLWYARTSGREPVGIDRITGTDVAVHPTKDLLYLAVGSRCINLVKPRKLLSYARKITALAGKEHPDRRDRQHFNQLVSKAREDCLEQVMVGMSVTTSGNCQLIVDREHDRLFFDRGVFALDDLSQLKGIFKPNPISQIDHPLFRELMRRFPALDQILAVSPDGSLVADGTHILDARTFAPVRELPLPTERVSFSADGRQVWFIDALLGVLGRVPVEPVEGDR